MILDYDMVNSASDLFYTIELFELEKKTSVMDLSEDVRILIQDYWSLTCHMYSHVYTHVDLSITFD